MSADRMADCMQKLQATISAAVKSFAYRSARSIFSWADGCSTRCDLFNLVPPCQVSRFQRPRSKFQRSSVYDVQCDVVNWYFGRPTVIGTMHPVKKKKLWHYS